MGDFRHTTNGKPGTRWRPDATPKAGLLVAPQRLPHHTLPSSVMETRSFDSRILAHGRLIPETAAIGVAPRAAEAASASRYVSPRWLQQARASALDESSAGYTSTSAFAIMAKHCRPADHLPSWKYSISYGFFCKTEQQDLDRSGCPGCQKLLGKRRTSPLSWPSQDVVK